MPSAVLLIANRSRDFLLPDRLDFQRTRCPRRPHRRSSGRLVPGFRGRTAEKARDIGSESFDGRHPALVKSLPEPEPCGWIRVERPTWPFSEATCRRVPAPPARPSKVAFPVHLERWASRPSQLAGGPLHPELYCMVPAETLSSGTMDRSVEQLGLAAPCDRKKARR